MRPRPLSQRSNLLLLLAFPLLHWLLSLPANVIWQPPAGLRFGLLLLLPRRYWLLMAIWLELAYRLVGQAGEWRGLAAFTAHFIAVSAGPWVLRRIAQPLQQDTRSWCLLMAAMLLSATCNALQIMYWPPDWARDLPAGELLLQVMLGDYAGMLLIAPLVLMIASPPSREQRHRWRRDLPMLLAPALAIMWMALQQVTYGRGYLLAAGFVLPLAIYMALRTGWRGVAATLGSSSLMLGIAAWQRDNVPATLEGQLLLALTGTALLLLGAAADTQHAAQRELQRRNVRLQRLSDELRSAAQRNLDLSEEVRRWITSELHDELGQNLTALQTRLVLVERHIPTPELLLPAWEILQSMRRSISELLSTLRPAGLEELGLVAALKQGAIRDMLDASGLDYRLKIKNGHGALDALDDRTRITLYRIVQEAATNTVRHARATAFVVSLRLHTDGRLGLLIVDDGRGLQDAARRGGIGLQGIRDRVLSRGGTLRLRSDHRGTLLFVRINRP